MLFVLLVPTSFAVVETRILGWTTTYFSYPIYPEIHQGQIQFSFTVSDSCEVAITNLAETEILWTGGGMASGSCVLDVNASATYLARFVKPTGWAVFIQFEINEPDDIPGFALLFTAFTLLAILGLISLRKRTLILSR